ncbi:Ubiquitin-conjugating enzyme E2 25 [Caenorhabditis elegans]|uniref:Ubiquitin-conjugating enzyme E2 25 n=1 Tax=Caenorhabditis elegans TaxID=6239 RepID=UBC25_CAEEL|nr:Ubiquitin-conjugating enzyme E2 25 [Caenorhabditis elegans]Q93571.2 RecName: Full=Ubiquitin-conjugating enzyme E2 25; AltName: Full=E2 ubiquitin-conjugating enzyme 25 [Caenorhabditis elegans]CAB02096.2 Ubiquitin-conjugating enzyme E2 25 [Caenorhabditis elegans]|eukprot:NP_492764.2 Ubiquitin-conjugating enzyme E2 25 [Caenorhabditis elegans]
MACLRKLKEDIQVLEKLFPKNHNRFQILSASVDELSMKFINAENKGIIVTANIQENYPRQPPIWFSESDDVPVIGMSLQRLTETEESTNILHQVHRLVSDLCSFYNLQMPCELPQIAPPVRDDIDEGRGSDISDTTSEPIDDDMAGDGEVDDDDEEEEDDEDADGDIEIVEMAEEDPTSQHDVGVSKEGLDMLDKVSKINRQQHLDGKVQGSITATDRLMKEIRDIHRSEHFKNGIYTFELEKEENLYQWWIKLHKVDEDSPLFEDMKKLKKDHNQDHLLFSFTFNEKFPCDPPFVRVVAPHINQGFVLGGGAICMELLTKQGWSSAYSIESCILQIAATLVKGRARISFDAKHTSTYSMARAQQSFKSLQQIHAKSGWYTPPKTEG